MSRYVKLGLIGVILIAAAAMVVAAVGGLSTTATAPEKIAGSGGGNNAPLPRTGGETCATATVIGALPYTDSGTTAGAVHDYDEVCPYSGSLSPDVVYSYTPAGNTSVSISLCTPGTNTDYDTKLYVYEGSCPGTVAGCNDDVCSSPLYASFVSELNNIPLTGGTTYYFVVDGYGSASGNYTISVDEFIVQQCPCPPGSDLYEGTVDPDCGNYTLPAVDPSGGCNSDAANPGPYVVPISCNTTICGTTSTYTGGSGDSRDTDWFELDLPQADTIRVTLTSSANLLLFDLSGEYNCGGVGVAQQLTEPGNCAGTGEMVISGVAGPNWIFVGPAGFGAGFGIPCPTEYILTVDCDVVPVDLESITIE